jgi:hypothetical protein
MSRVPVYAPGDLPAADKAYEILMEDVKVILPAAQPVSSGASGVSAPFSILPEKIAQQTGALGEAVLQLMAVPASEHRQAAAALCSKLEDVSQSFDQICLDAISSFHSVTAAAAEALRTCIEQSMHLMEDLAGAKRPSDAIRAQLGFFSAQMQLLADSSIAMQREFARFFPASPRRPGPAPPPGCDP